MTTTPWTGRAGPISAEQPAQVGWETPQPLSSAWGLGLRFSLFLLGSGGRGVQAAGRTLRIQAGPRRQQPSQEHLLPPLCKVPGEFPRAEGEALPGCRKLRVGQAPILGLWPVAEMGRIPGDPGGDVLACPVLNRSGEEQTSDERPGSLVSRVLGCEGQRVALSLVQQATEKGQVLSPGLEGWLG